MEFTNSTIYLYFYILQMFENIKIKIHKPKCEIVAGLFQVTPWVGCNATEITDTFFFFFAVSAALGFSSTAKKNSVYGIM